MATLKDYNYFGLTPIERMALAKELLESVIAEYQSAPLASAGQTATDTPQPPTLFKDGGR